jgi:hypothetical protein
LFLVLHQVLGLAVLLHQEENHDRVDEPKQRVPPDRDQQRFLPKVLENEGQRDAGQGVEAEVEEVCFEVRRHQEDEGAVAREVGEGEREGDPGAAGERHVEHAGPGQRLVKQMQ